VMAGKPVYDGYDYNFVDKVSERLNCMYLYQSSRSSPACVLRSALLRVSKVVGGASAIGYIDTIRKSADHSTRLGEDRGELWYRYCS
jgi:hypothetical protein